MKPLTLIKSLILSVLCLSIILPVHADDDLTIENRKKRDDRTIIENIAKQLIAETSYTFKNSQTDEVFTDLNERNYSKYIELGSPHLNWKYWNGVTAVAMMKLSETLNDNTYRDYIIKNYEFAFKHIPLFTKKYDEPHLYSNNPHRHKLFYPFGQHITMYQLDDCGAMGAGLIEVQKKTPRPEYEAYIKRAADYISYDQDRLYDRTFVRHWPHRWTLWGDDLYMSVVFLSRMGDYSGDNKYFDDAILQIENFHNYLWDEHVGAYHHNWYSDLKVTGPAKWGRCNGWMIMAKVELLDHLPEDYPGREKITELLFKQIVGLSRLQDISGLWRNILNVHNAYLETSATSMFIYAIAKSINEGWIDQRYISIALEGWDGLKAFINENFEVENICTGTTIRNDILFYYNRPAHTNELHGIGPVLLAGNEILRWKGKTQ